VVLERIPGGGEHMSLGWEKIVAKLKNNPDECHIIRIPVNREKFGTSLKSNFSSKISEMCEQGEIPVYLTLLKSGVIALTYCVKEGDCKDETGFDVDHNTWIHSYVEQDGKVIVPFELAGSLAFEEAAKEYGEPW
jgi:hypothetical protein